jgi:predicted nuclease of predicted toxin-antitoxin system
VRFLLDTCIGTRLAGWLRQQRHDVVRIVEPGPDPGDAAILARARAADRIPVTIEKDLGTLLVRDGPGHAGLVRLPHAPGEGQIRLMAQILDRHDAHELTGALVTVRGSRVAIRKADADAAG